MRAFPEDDKSTSLAMPGGIETPPSPEKGRVRKRRYTILFLLLSLLILASGASGGIARLFAGKQQMTVLAISSSKNIGMNYYHESMGYISRTNAEIDSDLSIIQQVSNKIKVYHNPYTNAGKVVAADSMRIVKTIVQKAKARRMYVVWTENDDSITLTDANWDDYAHQVIADGQEASAAGADEFLVGNEISLHNNGDPGYNDDNLPGRIKRLVTDCQGRFPGIKGYEEGWYKSENWHAATLGPLDKIYFTLYEPWYRFKMASDTIHEYFGKRAEIGELSTMATKEKLNYSEDDWTRELMRRCIYEEQKGLTMWLFTLREPQNNSFGLVYLTPPDRYHTIWDYLMGTEAIAYHEYLSNNFERGTTQAFSGQGYNYKGRLRADNFAQVVATIPASDYVFRGVVSPITSSGSEAENAMRLVFRYSNADNYYFLNIEPNKNRVELFRRQAGAETFLGGIPTSLQLGSDYDFEVRVLGQSSAATIQIYWNTQKIIDMHDEGNKDINSGGVGMKNAGVAGDIGDVIVTDFEQVEPYSRFKR